MRCIVSVWTIFSIIRYFNIKSSEDRGDITIIPDCVGESGPVVSVEKFPGPTPQSPAPSYLSCPTLTAGRQRQDEQFGQWRHCWGSDSFTITERIFIFQALGVIWLPVLTSLSGPAQLPGAPPVFSAFSPSSPRDVRSLATTRALCSHCSCTADPGCLHNCQAE